MPGENIVHFGAVRMRVTGSGSLKMRLQSLDNVKTSELVPFTMSSTTDREPLRLANFTSQRGKLKIYTTEINETFRINRVILFVKPIYTDYPA